MTDRLILNFRPEEGAVPRIVGLIERRGFALCAMTMTGASMTLDVAARDAGRTVSLLQRQLERLDGVGAVSTFSPPARARR